MLKSIIRLLLKIFPRPILIRMSLIANRVIALFYMGNKVECPVCGGKFRKFLPYGYTKQTGRDNALCPRCLSLERHRLMYLYLKEKTDFFTRDLKVLHIAPEQCFYKRFRALENLDYTTGDLESPIADVHFDVQAIPFSDETYDVVICNHVLEHVDDDAKAMSEIYRILKPGGFAILQVPQDADAEKTYEDASITDPVEREKHFLQKDHVRLYGLDYAERLTSVGFKVTADTYSNNFPLETAKRYALPLKEIFYFNQK
ncbi:class I SAM-dependent methyltransferase [Ancylomarina euxinus]|uniref:Class I SAM-dependent methyltransferase n=2 Tax=Ancylomarina euxinus TaxID=2283627 RepID=A0A425Y5J6_9BACT|nr:class I SAM-dependent methyltransferase [Ancylomarina euxinus]MCZ4694262.1 class I SAM-dependent methyltransferase [Ancylomarina euxinus]MUP14406.1 methyltransferase domain-containing protein [Ancylomarina euxinus]RRG23715.1 class I SAM-dependent methyltransferase [Ancylomarina euxinus]